MIPSVAAFERALPGYAFEFPRDHFEHPAFEIEWWYYTGNVKTAGGRRFGLRVDLFFGSPSRAASRRKLLGTSTGRISRTFALSDIEAGAVLPPRAVEPRRSGLAGAAHEKAAIWNGNWSSRWTADGGQSLFAVTGDVGIDFALRPVKPPVVNGVDGVSQKSQGLGRASHYISFTRAGDNRPYSRRRRGSMPSQSDSWMDHEFSSDSMGARIYRAGTG